MENGTETVTGTWGHALLTRFLHPFAIGAPPLALLGLVGILLWRGFGKSFPEGLRCFAGVLLPLVVASFILFYQRSLVERLGSVPVLRATVISFFLAVGAVTLVDLLWAHTGPIPLSEVVLSSCFSVLVLSYVVLPQTKVLSYFYGAVLGLLSYVVFFGLPLQAT